MDYETLIDYAGFDAMPSINTLLVPKMVWYYVGGDGTV